MSTISASTTTTTAFRITTDTAGTLVFQTGSTPTTAVTIDTSQRAAFVAGTAAAPAITTAGDTDTGIFFPAANTLAFSTNGTEDARFDANGNFGLGVTPSAWGTGSSVRALQFNSGSLWSFSNTAMYLGHNFFFNGTNRLYSNTGPAAEYQLFNGTHAWNIAGSGSAGAVVTFNQAMTLDASGNLGVGTTSPSYRLDISAASSNNAVTAVRAGSGYASVVAIAGNGTAPLSSSFDLIQDGTNAYIYQRANAPIIFGTNNTERARITAAGVLLVGVTATGGGGSHLIQAGTGVNSLQCQNNSATTPYGPYFNFSAASPNNTSQYFLACADTTNDKALIYANGTYASRTNTYGGISDIKVKQDIVDASSQWGDIKALRFRKYRFKDDPTGPLQLGLISQEAELVSPGLVFESPDMATDDKGNRVETGEVTKSVKYSILYMKAVVALQEAMNRIEQLETRLTALEAK
jgi:hypothetical protein